MRAFHPSLNPLPHRIEADGLGFIDGLAAKPAELLDVPVCPLLDPLQVVIVFIQKDERF